VYAAVVVIKTTVAATITANAATAIVVDIITTDEFLFVVNFYPKDIEYKYISQ
jgi:hypothetical protein